MNALNNVKIIVRNYFNIYNYYHTNAYRTTVVGRSGIVGWRYETSSPVPLQNIPPASEGDTHQVSQTSEGT